MVVESIGEGGSFKKERSMQQNVSEQYTHIYIYIYLPICVALVLRRIRGDIKV